MTGIEPTDRTAGTIVGLACCGFLVAFGVAGAIAVVREHRRFAQVHAIHPHDDDGTAGVPAGAS